MKNKLNQLLVLFFLIFTTQAFSNPIDKIIFFGLNKNSAQFIQEELPFKVGQEFSNTASNRIIEALFKTELFSDIQIEKKLNTLEITVIENPRIKYIDITTKSQSAWKDWLNNNNLLFSNDDLTELVNSSDVAAGNSFTEQKLKEFLSFLESKYINEGFYNVEIEVNSELDIQNRIGIEISVAQGERAKVNSLKIKGSTVFSEDELLKLFSLGEADFSFINYFTNKDNFSDAEFRNGLELITQKYFNSGYLDFSLLEVSTELSELKDKIFIEIIINEGIQYKLGNVSFEGDLGNQTSESLSDSLSIQQNDVFNRKLMMNDIQSLIDLYADQGYAFVDIKPITKDFLDTIDLVFSISLNDLTYVNRITISGNTRTQDSVIRRQINIVEGGLYSRTELRESIKKLRRLGYFSDVKMTATEVENMPDKIDLNFTVEETQTGAISFSVSHSNNYGISLGAGIQEKNIFGSGNTLNADLKFSESFNKIRFYFMNPNYNEANHSISFGAFKSEINDDEVASNSYEIDSTGLTLGYGIPSTKNTRINAGIEYSKNTIKCSTLFSGTGYESGQCVDKNKDEFKLNADWRENTLNDYLYPTEGVSNSLGAIISLPIGDYKYYNLNADHSSYQSISETMTLKLTGNLNLSKGYGNKELPFYRRHFGGGSGSIRGFGAKSLGPTYPNGKAKGGEVSILGSANLITPAFFFEDNDKMRLSVFIDAGNVFEKTSNIKLNQIRASAGIGFAYLSPIGSIGGFIATPLHKKNGDIIDDFGFSIGTGF
jgi:outer membrane protein insertion porin family